MWQYQDNTSNDELYHKWGFTKGKRNGNRTAADKNEGKVAITQRDIAAINSGEYKPETNQKNEGKVNVTQKDIDAINFKNNPSKEYNPDLKKTVKNGIPGYINSRGEFFSSKSGSSVKLQSWQADIKHNEEKVSIAAKNAPSTFEKAIESGKKTVSKLLKKLFK